jgi:hypothetical protein
MMGNKNPYNVKIGETWGENDPRYTCEDRRIVEVITISDGYAEIRHIKTGRRSRVRLDRFHGKRGGYSLMG